MGKYLLPLMLCAALLCGCGKSEKKLKIGISVPAATHGWTGGVVWHAEQAKKRLESANKDVAVTVATSGSGAAQVNAIEQLMMQNPDALVILSQEPEPLDNVCKLAKQRGIYLVVVSNPLPSKAEDVFVNGDNTSLGEAAAVAMGNALGGKGDILVMEGVLCPINTERVNGFKKILKAKYPKIRILDSQPTDWNTEKGLKLMEKYLQKYAKVDGVWAGDDDVLIGALKAYKESKRKDVKVFVGGGGAKAIVRMVKEKDPLVKATVTYPPRMIETGADLALKGLRNNKKNPGAREIVVKSEVVTPANAEKHYFPDSLY